MILKYAVDGKWFYVFQVGGRSFAKYGFETKEAAEEERAKAMANETREFVFRVVREAADQTEIVFPTLSGKLKAVYKVMTKTYPKPLIADLLDKEYDVLGGSSRYKTQSSGDNDRCVTENNPMDIASEKYLRLSKIGQ